MHIVSCCHGGADRLDTFVSHPTLEHCNIFWAHARFRPLASFAPFHRLAADNRSCREAKLCAHSLLV